MMTAKGSVQKISKQSNFDYKLAHQSFDIILHLTMVQHYNRFGNKRLSGSGDITWTKSGHTHTQTNKLPEGYTNTVNASSIIPP